jgi:hypothetical protein
MIVLTGVASITGPTPLAAQGIGHGQPPVAPGRSANTTTTTTPSSSTQPVTSSTGLLTEGGTATGVRLQTFGSWLDTADVSAPGEAWMSLSSAYWRSSSLREVDVPSMGVTVGVARRIQFGVSLPYYHTRGIESMKACAFSDRES